jgi:hypothetical protein
MTVDKWWDAGGFNQIFQDQTWPVHDRIAGIQATAMTMILNPTTLNRMYDVEFTVPADEDCLTVPEVMSTVSDEIWSEIEGRPKKSHTARKPLISSLRRNLQSEHVERLIDLSLPNPGFGATARTVANLSTYQLRELHGKMETMITKHEARLDPYSMAHLSEAHDRIGRALDAQYIYNTDDISAGGGMPMFIFGEPTGADSR